MRNLFVWDDKYSVNNEVMDNHHMILINIFNKLYNNCMENNNNVKFETVLTELVSYIHYHFSTEEQYMNDIGYKDIDGHISDHKLFVNKILQLQCESINNDYENKKELILYLGKWLVNHVMKEDKKYSL